MTKAGLIEELCLAMDMTRKASEDVDDTIFDSVVRLRNGDRSKFGVLEAFARANANRVLAVIRKRAPVWKFRPSVFLISSPVRN